MIDLTTGDSCITKRLVFITESAFTSHLNLLHSIFEMKLPLIAIGVLQSLCAASSGAVIYHESFSATVDAVAVPASSIGWTTVGGNWKFANSTGKPQDLPNINSGSETITGLNPTGQIATGFVWNDTSSGDSLITTAEYTIASSLVSQLATISWYQGNANTSMTSRVAIQIAGNWYATDLAFSNSAAVSSGGNFGNSSGGAVLMSFDWTAVGSQWRELTIAGNDVTLSGSVLTEDLPSGDITGFGLYFSDRGATQRFDSFQIETIPETSTLALVGLGAVTLMRRRRK
jgi:hypothetical protein